MELSGSPFVWLRFDERGALRDHDALRQATELLGTAKVDGCVVLSHGWNNELADAEALYTGLWRHASGALADRGATPERLVVLGVLWPAKRYDADYDGAGRIRDDEARRIAQGTDEGGLDQTDEDEAALRSALDQVRVLVDDPSEATELELAARNAVERPDTAGTFFRVARRALGHDAGDPDPELRDDARLFARADTDFGAEDLLAAYGMPKVLPAVEGAGSALGLADSLAPIFAGPRSAVIWALNKLTYYTMKKRAGVVGEALGRLLGAIDCPVLPLHLCGHSFGGRLVTACALALPDPREQQRGLALRSMTLLQAAYSHNGLTQGQGPFAQVVGRPTGAISYTHTHNDRACSVAYPLASRLSGDTAKSLGDADDRFGAMGANGPQIAAALLAPDQEGTDFQPVPGKINRFRADSYVVKTESSDAHNNVANEQCGQLLAATILA